MSKAGITSGITSKTPKKTFLGAGTIHKNLKFVDGAWNLVESLIGATQGGSAITITPTITTVEVDGAYVKIKGMQVKTEEVATMELNILEITPETIKLATFGEIDTASSDFAGYTEIKSKAEIDEGDYVDNIAFVGHTLDGQDIIVIMENALCNSGLSFSSNNSEASLITATFECHAEVTDDTELQNFKKLPWHILIENETSEAETASETVTE